MKRLPSRRQVHERRAHHLLHPTHAVYRLTQAARQRQRALQPRVALPVRRCYGCPSGHTTTLSALICAHLWLVPHAPYFVSRPAWASARGSASMAGNVPSEPFWSATSLKASQASARVQDARIRNGTGCQEWPAITAGVEWSPATISTSGSSARSAGTAASTSSRFAPFRSKSPSPPGGSVFLWGEKK